MEGDMFSKHKIRYGDPRPEMERKMSEGDPRVKPILDSLIDRVDVVYLENDLGPWFGPHQLDHLGIYGSDICQLHQTVCAGKIDALITIIVAEIEGLISAEDIHSAIASATTLNPTLLAQDIRRQGGKLYVDIEGPRDRSFGQCQPVPVLLATS
jgi:hypothetical protein